jgi:sugar phosphate isomerase/epimerase
MRYAICNETFQDWPFDKAFEFAHACGYTGLEMAPYTMHPDVRTISRAQRDAVRAQAARAQLEIIGLHWLLAQTAGLHVTSPDESVRRRTSDYLGELARLCRDLGGHILVLGSPQQRNLLPGVQPSEAMQYAAEVLRGCVPALEEHRITLAIEPLGPQDSNFLNTADEGRELVTLVGSPHCRLNLDVKAMSTEDTPIPQIIRRHAKWMVHFHANDANRRGPGMGDVDFVPILQALREAGYAGWISVEVFDYAPGVESLARDSIAYLRQCESRLH